MQENLKGFQLFFSIFFLLLAFGVLSASEMPLRTMSSGEGILFFVFSGLAFIAIFWSKPSGKN